MDSDRFYLFGPFCLDTLNRTLLRDGGLVGIQPKAYEVLLILVKNCGRTVAREELMNAIWGLHVSEGVLNYQINQLRKALKDIASKPQYIQTFPKRGFRFIARVTASSDAYLGPARIQESAAPEGTEQIARYDSADCDEPSAEPVTRLLDSNHDAIPNHSPARKVNLVPNQIKKTKALGGHLPHVLACCSLYAALFAIGLLAEIAYGFDKYGTAGVILAMAIYAWIFVSSLTGFGAAYRLARAEKPTGLFVSFSVFLLAALLAFAGACWLLPSSPITQARFQTYTAEAAYLKTIFYFLLIVPFYMLIPFHFIITLEREIEGESHTQVLKMLIGNNSTVYPKGSFYLRPWMLLLLLSVIIATALYLHSNLFDNLIISAYSNLFSILIYLRLIIYIGLGLTCLAWYYQKLNDVRLKCLERDCMDESRVTE